MDVNNNRAVNKVGKLGGEQNRQELSVEQGFSRDFPPKGHLTVFGDMFGCHILAGGATGVWWVETTDAAC